MKRRDILHSMFTDKNKIKVDIKILNILETLKYLELTTDLQKTHGTREKS